MVFTNFKHETNYGSLDLQKCITPWEHSKSALGQMLKEGLVSIKKVVSIYIHYPTFGL